MTGPIATKDARLCLRVPIDITFDLRHTVSNGVTQSSGRRDLCRCGFCTAGMLLTCTALLQAHPQPTREHIGRYLNGNICRCGAYVQILEAIQDGAVARRV